MGFFFLLRLNSVRSLNALLGSSFKNFWGKKLSLVQHSPMINEKPDKKIPYQSNQIFIKNDALRMRGEVTVPPKKMIHYKRMWIVFLACEPKASYVIPCSIVTFTRVNNELINNWIVWYPVLKNRQHSTMRQKKQQ